MKMNEFKKLKNIKLSDSEKKNLFARISNKISEGGETKLRYPEPSPFFRFSFLVQSKHMQMAAFSVFILLGAGATTFASINTLPGDLLYGVKTQVVEKIPTIFHLSPESRAKDSSEKIEKRIDEFEKLAEKGRLTEKNTKKIEKEIKKNFGDFDKNIEKTKEKKEKTRLEEELGDSLERHSEKIKKIRENDETSDRRALESVLERVRSSHEGEDEEKNNKEEDALEEPEEDKEDGGERGEDTDR
ncbi:MAG TPA: hypothetical protein VJH06_01110 [Candidatus Paceibacterota bacterium]